MPQDGLSCFCHRLVGGRVTQHAAVHTKESRSLSWQAMQHLPAFLPIAFKFQGKDILTNEPNEHLEKGLNSTNMLI